MKVYRACILIVSPSQIKTPSSSLLKGGHDPWDLETWGLSLDPTEKEKTARLLVRLLPHPVWERRVDILRYVLQKTVGYRLKSKLNPLGPLAPGAARGLATATRGLPDASSIAFTVWEESNPGTNYNIARLLEAISKKAAALNEPSKLTQMLILEPEDVIIVNEALDALSQDVLPPYTVDQYWDSFVRHHPLWPGDMAPYDAETIVRWDKLSAAEQLYRMISKKPDIPPKERENNEELRYWKSPRCGSRVQSKVIWTIGDSNNEGSGGT
ncbi:hypothetical protein Hte_009313 [Hypoxylon texense]